MSAQAVTTPYWAWLGSLCVVYYALPAWRPAVWTAVGLTGIAAVVAGVYRNRPRQRAPWLLIAAGLGVSCAGDTVYNVLAVSGRQNPFPSAADILYLIMVPPLAGGLVLLTRAGAAGRARAGLLDAFMITLGVGLLTWILLIRPEVFERGLTLGEQLAGLAYPLGCILVVLTAARLLATARRDRPVILLATGAAALLASGVWYGLSQLGGGWSIGGAADLGWFLFYGAWGAAALDPAMVRLTEPRPVPPARIGPRRLALLAAAALAAPLILLVEALAGEVRDGIVIAVVSAAMFAAVLVRLAGVVATHRQALARERALRVSAAALVSAADTEQVVDAIRAALPALLPPGAEHQTWLTVDGQAEPDGDENGYGAVLRCPLASSSRPGGRLRGELVVAADAAAVTGLRPALEVLTSQAALALERITLSDEVNRRISEEYFRTLAHNSTDVILILDGDRAGSGATTASGTASGTTSGTTSGTNDRIRYASPSAARVLGHPVLTGVRLLDLVSERDRQRARYLLDGVQEGELSTEYADWTVVRADGTTADVEVSCRDLRADPTIAGLVLTLRDVTERRRLEAELSHRALHDALTGLANRILFHDRTNRAVQRAQRAGTLVGVLFVDLDDFKVINDTLGHQRGDQLLIAVGRRLTGVLRDHDTAARLGGDEFAILVEDATHPADIEQVAERVLAALAVPVDVAGEMLNANASVGVAISADARDTPDLLRQADLALYLAKSEGKHQWRRYETALHTALLQRLELRAALEQAVAEEAFVLHFQPIVELDGGAAVGFEALIRWQHPERGLVPPGEFIEVAEESGLIVPIGSWVLRTAIATMARWRTDQTPRRDGDPHADLYIAVNVSARQFRTPDFVELVRRELAAASLPPHALLLEITETLLLRDDDQVWTDLATLRALGVRVAIDDFGTGYSSLSYLRQVPIDVLKIDKSFVRSMAGSPQQAALVDGIVRLAHTLGLQVVAEGIEDAAERDLLLDMGCELGQGYLFARPMAAADAVRAAGGHRATRESRPGTGPAPRTAELVASQVAPGETRHPPPTAYGESRHPPPLALPAAVSGASARAVHPSRPAGSGGAGGAATVGHPENHGGPDGE